MLAATSSFEIRWTAANAAPGIRIASATATYGEAPAPRTTAGAKIGGRALLERSSEADQACVRVGHQTASLSVPKSR